MEPRVLKSINGPARIKVKSMDQLLKDPAQCLSTSANKAIKIYGQTSGSQAVSSATGNSTSQVVASASSVQTKTTNSQGTPKMISNPTKTSTGKSSPVKTYSSVKKNMSQLNTSINIHTNHSKNKTLHNTIKQKKTIKRVHLNPFIMNSNMTASEKNIIAQAFALINSKSPGKINIVTNTIKTEPNVRTGVRRPLNYTPKSRKLIIRAKLTQSKTSASTSKDPAEVSPGQENTAPAQTEHSLLAKNLLLEELEAGKTKTYASKKKETTLFKNQGYYEVPIVGLMQNETASKTISKSNDDTVTKAGSNNVSPISSTNNQVSQKYVQVAQNIDTPRPKLVAVPNPPIIIVSPLKSKSSVSPQNQTIINSQIKAIAANQHGGDTNKTAIAELMNINKELIITPLKVSDNQNNLNETEENTVCLVSDDEEPPVCNDKDINKKKETTEPSKETNSEAIKVSDTPEKACNKKTVRTKTTKRKSATDMNKDTNALVTKTKTSEKSKPGPARKKAKTILSDSTNTQQVSTESSVEENNDKIQKADSSIQSFIVSDEEDNSSDKIEDPTCDENPKIIQIPDSPEKDVSLCPPTNKLSESESRKVSRLNFESSEPGEIAENSKVTENLAEVINDSGIDCVLTREEHDTPTMTKPSENEEAKSMKVRRRFVRRKKLVYPRNWMKLLEERTDKKIAEVMAASIANLQASLASSLQASLVSSQEQRQSMDSKIAEALASLASSQEQRQSMEIKIAEALASLASSQEQRRITDSKMAEALTSISLSLKATRA